MPIMAFQELNAPGHGAEKIRQKTPQIPAFSSNTNPAPLPKLLEPQGREQQPSISTPSAYPEQTRSRAPYKHSATLEEIASQTLGNFSVSLRCICYKRANAANDLSGPGYSGSYSREDRTEDVSGFEFPSNRRSCSTTSVIGTTR